MDHSDSSPAGGPIVLGQVALDNTTSTNATIQIQCSRSQQLSFVREVYVGIRDKEKTTDFLGRIVAGPFHLEAPANNLSVSEEYEMSGRVEVLGEVTEVMTLIPTHTRPGPGSRVYLFPPSALRSLLKVEGDMCIGHLIGQREARVDANSQDKNLLPRNVGVFGTVGSGKSNSAQVLAEEAAEHGWAVVVIDVEGEYVRMNEPSQDPYLLDILKADYGLGPKGAPDLQVFVPSAGYSAAESSIPFKVPVSQLDFDMVGDILDFSVSEARVYRKVSAQAAREHALPEDDHDASRPYSLQHLVDGLIEGPSYDGNPTLRLLPLANASDVATASNLRSKLIHLGHSQMIDWHDTEDVPELPIDGLMVPGRISVVDVSETDNASRNLGIAYVLQELFNRVMRTPIGEKMPSGRERPPVLVIIEEIHTFVPRSSVLRMRSVLDALQIITRRGRKRWMSLVMVSQQPNHVPDEIFELANTRFLHQVKSESNLRPLRETTGGVEDALWDSVPALGPGECLLTGPIAGHPLFASIRPARSRRLLVT